MTSIDLNQAELAGFAGSYLYLQSPPYPGIRAPGTNVYCQLSRRNFGDRFACDHAAGAAIIGRLHQFAGGQK